VIKRQLKSVMYEESHRDEEEDSFDMFGVERFTWPDRERLIAECQAIIKHQAQKKLEKNAKLS